uniref:Uncharacterized protein n=1 Tax=Vibrio tasmaniensis TaxID=212663 RepID=A0A0H3ZWM5_9VIBR|nr:hypothetical protein [Vibrio tasmaniensis]AKN40753.1 hypothetical protein [Vibrio tasmaniensis]
MGGFFVGDSHNRLKGSLRSIAFGINLFPRCEKTTLQGGFFRDTKTCESVLSPFMIAHIKKTFQ